MSAGSAGRMGPRGWLMRRLLLVADVVGLTAAFLIAMALASPESVVRNVEVRWEILLFTASLPLWVLLAGTVPTAAFFVERRITREAEPLIIDDAATETATA